MQKINFNDRYGLTQAVIEGRKTMTRRIITKSMAFTRLHPENWSKEDIKAWNASFSLCVNGMNKEERRRCLDYVRDNGSRYKQGEIVAVAQRYEDVEELSYLLRDPFSETYFEEVNIGDEPGYRNKMFVKAELMPHQIRITGIRCERLQDISDDDCFREGISESWYESTDTTTYGYADEKKGTAVEFDTPREAFAALIDRVSGKGTWERNPWVVVYEFELLK